MITFSFHPSCGLWSTKFKYWPSGCLVLPLSLRLIHYPCLRYHPQRMKRITVYRANPIFCIFLAFYWNCGSPSSVHNGHRFFIFLEYRLQSPNMPKPKLCIAIKSSTPARRKTTLQSVSFVIKHHSNWRPSLSHLGSMEYYPLFHHIPLNCCPNQQQCGSS